MQCQNSEYAMIEVSVTTAGGIVPIKNAEVTVLYNALPGISDSGKQVQLTDACGRAKGFKLPVRRAVIGGVALDFPRRAQCDIEILAEGYVPFRARGVHLFPRITVISSFDLIPKTV